MKAADNNADVKDPYDMPIESQKDVNYSVDLPPRTLQSLVKRQMGALWVKGRPNLNTPDCTWRLRHFVLSNLETEEPLQLHWFDIDNDNKGADGSPVILDAADVRIINGKDPHWDYEKGPLEYQFQLELVTGEVILLAADTKDEQVEWVETFNTGFQLFRHRSACHRIQPDYAAVPSTDLYAACKDDKKTWEFLFDKAQAFNVMGNGMFSAVAGKEAEFSLHNTDEHMSHCVFSATLSNEEYFYKMHLVDTEEREEALYTCSYCISAAGEYQLAVKMNGDHHVYGSPFNVVVEAAECKANMCIARGDGLFSARPGEIMTFTIISKDAFGNERKTGGDLFEVTLEGPGFLKNVVDNGNGTFSCAYELSLPSGPGRDPINVGDPAVGIHIQLDGKAIQGSPFYPKLETPEQEGAYKSSHNLLTPASSSNYSYSAKSRTLPPRTAAKLPKSPFPNEAATSRAQKAKRSGPTDKEIQAAADRLLASPPPPPRRRPVDFASSASKSKDGPPTLDTKSQLQELNNVRNTVLTPGKNDTVSKLGSLTASLSVSEKVTSDIVRSASALANNNGVPEHNEIGSSVSVISGGPSSSVPALTRGGRGNNLLEEDLYRILKELESDPGVRQMFDRHVVQLEEVFEYYAQGSGGGNRQKLLTVGGANERRGLLRLAQDFDISPTFLTKRDVKLIMDAVLKVSGNTGSGLNREWYIKLLGLMAVRALSKPSFQHLYPTYQAKVGVLLEMWGLADPVKLNMIRQQRS